MEDLLIKDVGLAASLTRPEPPYELDDEEAIEWRRIVNSMPADHFIPANYHVLIELCQHIVESRRATELIRSYCKKKDRADVKIYLELRKAKEDETNIVKKLSSSCRITQQSTHNPTAVNLKRVAARMVDMSEEESWGRQRKR